MAAKKMNVIIWLIKAAELDVIRKSCIRNLVGLHFDLILTLPYAMCLSTISEIFTTLEIEDDKNIISTTRFSNGGLLSKEEMEVTQNGVVRFAKKTPINIDIWQEVGKSYFEIAMKKASASINRTFDELSKMPGNTFTLLIVNNDRMPLLEFMAATLNKSIKIPTEGEVVQLRFEGTIDEKDVNMKLVYASHHPVQ